MAYSSKWKTKNGDIVPVGSNLFGTCTAGSSDVVKTVSMPEFNVLTEGVTIHVYFANSNSASAPQLKVGSTDAKTIQSNGNNAGIWDGGAVISFTYQNGYWIQNDVNGTEKHDTTKVDKVDGKGLSTNDFTTTLKDKLEGIAAGAEVNVNADWNASSGDAQILNKPSLGAAASKGVITAISGDSADLPTVTAVKNYVASAVTGATAFQGVAPSPFAPTDYKAGYYWVVQTAGTYVGETCEAGDMIFAISDYSSAYSASDFEVIQNNLITITNAEIDTIVAS